MDHFNFLIKEYPAIKSAIPPGKSGNCAINKLTVKPLPDEVEIDASVPPWARRIPGIYTQLTINGETFMTDLFEELWSQRLPILKTQELGGHVLISGLGLGLIINAIFILSNGVSRITVIEKNNHVINLVASHLLEKYPKLDIIHEDILDYDPPPDAMYSVVWHDIWPNPHQVPQAEIDRLTRKFNNLCHWQGVWDIDSF